jgi:flagellar basal-body rod protein FlgB
MADKLTDALSFHQQALKVRAYRQQVLSSNIANADTPNYKARDLDFKGALQAALGQGQGEKPLAQTSLRHLQPASAGAAGSTLRFRTEQQSSVDGNTVNLDTERAQFAENALQYEASLTFVSQYMRTLQTSITGQ